TRPNGRSSTTKKPTACAAGPIASPGGWKRWPPACKESERIRRSLKCHNNPYRHNHLRERQRKEHREPREHRDVERRRAKRQAEAGERQGEGRRLRLSRPNSTHCRSGNWIRRNSSPWPRTRTRQNSRRPSPARNWPSWEARKWCRRWRRCSTIRTWHATPASRWSPTPTRRRSEEHTSELQSLTNLVCRLLLVKRNLMR